MAFSIKIRVALRTTMVTIITGRSKIEIQIFALITFHSIKIPAIEIALFKAAVGKVEMMKGALLVRAAENQVVISCPVEH